MSTARVYIETYGCSLNFADSETMAGLLAASGYEIVTAINDADAVILNSCTVKDKTFRNFVRRLHEIETLIKQPPRCRPRDRIIVTGCIPKPYVSTSLLADYSYLGVDAMAAIAAAVERVLGGEKVQQLDGAPLQRLNSQKLRAYPVIEIVPIAQGCLGSCAYCQTRIARGELRSYPVEQIVAHARCAVERGAKELWITAQDTGAYGLDIKTNIVELLRALVALPGDFQIRLGMANPNHVLNHVDELLDIFHEPKLFRFLHVPLQSGSDRVLRSMNREYRAGDVRAIIEAFRSAFERFSIATDVICGFPGESDDDFERTLSVLREVKPAVINRSRFGARPFTAAASMKPVPQHIIAERSRRLAQRVEELSYEDNKTWIGWSGSVLIDQQKKAGSVLARNFAYKPVVIASNSIGREEQGMHESELLLGKRVDIRISEATTFHFMGRVTETP